MTSQDSFGGAWTREKLECLQDYLRAYMKILEKHSYFRTIYVDAFAGTGVIPLKTQKEQGVLEELEIEVEAFLKGSATIALEIAPTFNEFRFIEKNVEKAQELETLRRKFPYKAETIHIIAQDANTYLPQWIESVNWRKTRAVVFLDPYGMQIEWQLLETIAKTKGVDLWLLVPIGMGVNRMMTKEGLPPQAWQDRLTRFLGTDEWKERFYKPAPVEARGLFDEDAQSVKVANYAALEQYFVERLQPLFGKECVAPKPLTQYNSHNSPMFLLCFASANPTGVKIAHHLLTRKKKGSK
ncbi:hypothetical protein LBMAG21_04030 [Armatimonadota bacterium]|nr:hypothetical protein LBMAG21_04030 [Armatimonadota bacterium]